MITRFIADREIGPGQPVYVIGEIGINHNGDIDVAKKLIEIAAEAGCDAVKFQKRTPEVCVPTDQRDIERDTPWGRMTYLDYRYRVEFDADDYRQLSDHCALHGIQWFASPWDQESVEFLQDLDTVAYKVASASLTDDPLLECMARTGKPIILSTGMSTMDEIRHAVSRIPHRQLMLMHSTSAYPCSPDELNLRMIATLRHKFPDVPVGYSGHETGLQTTVAAVALGATLVERHITLDRAMWGSDQAASLEPGGLQRLVRDIRIVERAMGDGVKRVYESELAPRAKLRRAVATV